MRTFLIVALVLLGGCRKKAALQFYELESRATILAERDGDEGLLSDEMAQLITGLKAIPADSREGPQATALVSKLEGDRQAATKRKEATDLAVRQAAAPPTAIAPPVATDLSRAVAPDASVGAPDAGPSMPWANMTLEEFQARFGACMDSAGDLPLSGGGTGPAWEVSSTPTCALKYGITDPDTHRFFLFRDGRLVQERTEQKRLVMIDAGPPPPPPPAPTAPYVMGMPVPGAEVPDAQ